MKLGTEFPAQLRADKNFRIPKKYDVDFSSSAESPERTQGQEFPPNSNRLALLCIHVFYRNQPMTKHIHCCSALLKGNVTE